MKKNLLIITFILLSAFCKSQYLLNWKTVNVNGTLYTLKVDADVSQLNANYDLFYSANRNHVNSFFLTDNNNQRMINSDIEQNVINVTESFFNLGSILTWPDEVNFQINPTEVTYYTGTDNQNNVVNLYFPSAFSPDYFNSHVWIGYMGFEGLQNYARRKNCYKTIWESCLMPEVSLLMNMEDIEKEIFEQWGDQIIEIFGAQTTITKSTLLVGLAEFRNALNLQAQVANSIKTARFEEEVDHLMSIISLQSSTLALTTNALLGILTYNFSRAYSIQRAYAIDSMFNSIAPNTYDPAMYEGFLNAKTNILNPGYTARDIILDAFLGSQQFRLSNTFQLAISKSQDIINDLVENHVIPPSLFAVNAYLFLELLDEINWLYEGETLFQYVSISATIQRFVGLYISTHLNTNNFRAMENLLSLYDVMTFSSLNFYNYQKQRMTLSPPNWLVGALNTFQVWFSTSGITGYVDYLNYLDYWIGYYLYGNTQRYFFVKNPVNMLTPNHKIYLQENIYPFIQGSENLTVTGNQGLFSITYRNSISKAPNYVKVNLNNQLSILTCLNSSISQGVSYYGTVPLNTGVNNYSFLANISLEFPNSTPPINKTFLSPFSGNYSYDYTQSALYNASVTPPSQGNTSTNFQFSVVYKDIEAPQYVKIIGSWGTTTMTAGTGIFPQGVQFAANKTFSNAGTYTYYFEAKSSNGEILRYPTTGNLTLNVGQNMAGWEIETTGVTSNHYYLANGGNVNVTGTSHNDCKTPDKIYYNVPYRFQLISPTGTVLDQKTGIIAQINQGLSVSKTETFVLPNTSGNYTVVFTIEPIVDNNWQNNSSSVTLIVGQSGPSHQFRINESQMYVVLGTPPTYNQCHDFAPPSTTNDTYCITDISGSKVEISQNGDPSEEIDLRDFTEFNSDQVALICEWVNTVGIERAGISFGYESNNYVTFDNTLITCYPGDQIAFTANCTSSQFKDDDPEIYRNANVDDWFDDVVLSNGNHTAVYQYDVPSNAPIGTQNFYMGCEFSGSDGKFLRNLKIKVISQPPQVNSINLNMLSAYDTVKITGIRFGTTGSVKFNTLQATTIISWSNTFIKCLVPSGVLQGNIYVINSNGTSNGTSYQVISSTGNVTVSQPIPDQAFPKSTTITVANLYNVFSNPNGYPMTYSVVTSSPNLSCSLSSGILSVTTNSLATGANQVFVTATVVATNKIAKDTFNVFITNAISGFVRYNNLTNSPLDTIKLYLVKNGVKVDSTFTNPYGYYYFGNKTDGTYSFMFSTKRAWQKCNSTDALKIERHINGSELLSPAVRKESADVNNDDIISATDVGKVKRRFTGLDNTFSGGDWVFCKTTTSTTVVILAGYNVSQDFHGLFLGDVNGSYGAPSMTTLDAPITKIGSANGLPGSTLTFPITVTNFTNISAYSFMIEYNPQVLTYLSASNIHSLFSNTLIHDNHVNNSLHRIMVAWSNTIPVSLTNESKLFDLNFTYISGTTSLTLNNSADGGIDCEYADESGNVLNDLPTSEFYFNAPETGIPYIDLSPSYLVFGNVSPGNNSIAQSYTVKGYYLTGPIAIVVPTGFDISSNASGPWGANLSLNQSGGTVSSTIFVRFSPTGPINYSGSILHASSGATSKTVIVSGTSTITSVINVSPSSLSFGNVPVGTNSAVQPYQITGSNIISSVSITAPSAFLIADLAGGPWGQYLTLTPNTGTISSTIYVRFSPPGTGVFTGTILNIAAGVSTKTVFVSGTGTNTTNPSISGYINNQSGVGIDGVTVTFSNSGVSVLTNSSGSYTNTVTYGYSGTASPTKTDYLFIPASRTYTNVTIDIIEQNYTGITLQLPYQENFEPYGVNDYLALSNPMWWRTWNNQPGTSEDALIMNTYSHSSSKSALIEISGSTPNDVLLKLGNRTTGNYELKWWMYIETTKAGYYNVLHSLTPLQFAFQITFRQSGSALLETGNDTLTFNYPKATWFEVKHLIDLDNDLITLYVNGSVVSQWPFSYTPYTTTGIVQLAAVDFFAHAENNETPGYYFDDVYFGNLPPTTALTVNPTALSFETVMVGSNSVPQSYLVSGSNLSGNVNVQAPAGFSVARSLVGTWGSSLILSPTSGTLSSTVYVRFSPPGTGVFTGTILNITPGVSTKTVLVSGTGTSTTNPSISGHINNQSGVGIDGVTVTFSNSMGSVLTNSSGTYTKTVTYGYSGTASPTKTDYLFIPASRTYTNVTADIFQQNYTGITLQLPYQENFEPYGVNDYLALSNPMWWRTWNNQPGTSEDALIMNTYSHSSSKSALIEISGSTPNDVLLKLGNRTTGNYELKWWMYIESDKAGYYNIQHYQTPGIQWAFEIYFLQNGSGLLYAGSATPSNFTYPKATWFEVKHLIELDNNLITLFINGVMVAQWPFNYTETGTNGINQLGAVDFFAGAVTGETPGFYIDDLYFGALTPTPVITVNPTNLSFGTVNVGSSSMAQSYQVNGSNLIGNASFQATTGFAICSTIGGTYGSSLSFSPTSGTVSSTVYVKFTPLSAVHYAGTITNSSPGAITKTVAVTGTGTLTTNSVISGYVKDQSNMGIDGVTVFFSNGGGNTTTNISGFYTKTVSFDYSGIATPQKTDHVFTPVSRTYTNVTTDLINQDYTGISIQLPYQENFEFYAVNDYLALSNPLWWRTWNNSPGTNEDALILNTYSNSPSRSARIGISGGTLNDVLLKLGDRTTGNFELKWWMYVENTKGGYYNLQHYQAPGTQWAFEIYFLQGGGGLLYAGSTTPLTFTYPKATWFEVKHQIDLDNDQITLHINGSLVAQWPFTYTATGIGGTNQLGAVDFFAGAATGETPDFYIDDVYFNILPSIPSQLTLSNVTVSGGQVRCYGATQTIIVAGNGSSFTMQSGASVTMIAGQNIKYLPATSIQSGAYLSGYITTNGTFCPQPTIPAILKTELEFEPVSKIIPTILIYPNPTTGNFVIETSLESIKEEVFMDVFSSRGERILSVELQRLHKNNFSLEDRPTGLYFIRVSYGHQIKILKLVKQ